MEDIPSPPTQNKSGDTSISLPLSCSSDETPISNRNAESNDGPPPKMATLPQTPTKGNPPSSLPAS
jgi:hypothetical protein